MVMNMIKATCLLAILLSFACARVSGGTEHKVSGEAKIRIEIVIATCDELPEDKRPDCVSKMLEVLKTVNQAQEDGDDSAG